MSLKIGDDDDQDRRLFEGMRNNDPDPVLLPHQHGWHLRNSSYFSFKLILQPIALNHCHFYILHKRHKKGNDKECNCV